MTIEPAEWDRFLALRAELFAAIRREFDEGAGGKVYEGHFRVTHSLPNYAVSQATTEDEHALAFGHDWAWRIHLDCYLIGPHRHYQWAGETFTEALVKAETDIRAWIAGNDESRHFIED